MWDYLKRQIRDKRPKTIDELTKYTIEIWNSIPKKMIKRYFTNYIERLKWVICLEGDRLSAHHYKEIRKKQKEEEEKKLEEKEAKEEEKGEEKEEDQIKKFFSTKMKIKFFMMTKKWKLKRIYQIKMRENLN